MGTNTSLHGKMAFLHIKSHDANGPIPSRSERLLTMERFRQAHEFRARDSETLGIDVTTLSKGLQELSKMESWMVQRILL